MPCVCVYITNSRTQQVIQFFFLKKSDTLEYSKVYFQQLSTSKRTPLKKKTTTLQCNPICWLNNIPLPRFAGTILKMFCFSGCFTKIFVVNKIKQGVDHWVTAIPVSCDQLVLLPSRGGTVIIRNCL